MNSLELTPEKGNLNVPFKNGFAWYLYNVIVIEERFTVQAVSKGMGISASKIYKWWENERDDDKGPKPSLEDFIAYLDWSHDFGYLSWIVRRYGKRLADEIKDKKSREVLMQIVEMINSIASINAGNGGDRK